MFRSALVDGESGGADALPEPLLVPAPLTLPLVTPGPLLLPETLVLPLDSVPSAGTRDGWPAFWATEK